MDILSSIIVEKHIPDAWCRYMLSEFATASILQRSSFTPELIRKQLMLPLLRCNAYFSKARHVFAVVRKCYSGLIL